jgi:hypothetical protein
MMGYYDGETYQYFGTLKRFIKFIINNETPKDIYAHNGGKFDFMFILKELVKHPEIQIVSIIPRGSSLLSIEIRIGDRKVIFRDSLALLSFSLKKLTEAFEVPVKKGEWDHSTTQKITPELVEYNKSDCIGLWQVLHKFWDQDIIKKAGPANTIAGQALKVFQTFIETDHDACSKTVDHFVRKAYFGGRTEIFKPIHNTKQKLYEYDINSMYPYVMKAQEYPVGKGIFTFQEIPNKLGVYEAEVLCPQSLHVPVLGILYNGKYCFPAGRFKGRWTSCELELARSKGYEVKILRGVYWEKSAKIFEGYVDTLYSLRQQATKGSVQDIVCKLLLNSLYGRFALNTDRENITLDMKEATKEYLTLKFGNVDIELFKKEVKLDTWTYSPWSVFVTSYARIHLYGFLDTDLCYTDTDSLFTTQIKETSTELGGLKLENEYASAVFLLPKTYSLEGAKRKIAMKGFERNLMNQVSHDDFVQFFEGELKMLSVKRGPKFCSFKTALKQNKFVTMDKGQIKEIKSKYDKRIIYRHDNQWLTRPITLGGINGDNPNQNTRCA